MMKLQELRLKIQKRYLESSKAYLKTPIGIAEIEGTEEGVESIKILNEEDFSFTFEAIPNIPEPLQNCILQLKEYLEGTRKEFDLKLNPKGTDFQKKVWRELLKIPYGKTF